MLGHYQGGAEYYSLTLLAFLCSTAWQSHAAK